MRMKHLVIIWGILTISAIILVFVGLATMQLTLVMNLNNGWSVYTMPPISLITFISGLVMGMFSGMIGIGIAFGVFGNNQITQPQKEESNKP